MTTNIGAPARPRPEHRELRHEATGQRDPRERQQEQREHRADHRMGAPQPGPVRQCGGLRRRRRGRRDDRAPSVENP